MHAAHVCGRETACACMNGVMWLIMTRANAI